jgi:general secretion pathway protein I
MGASVSRARPDRGFSLIEALVALAVFATAGVALVVMQGQSASTAAALKQRAIAALAAQNLLVETAAQANPAPNGVTNLNVSLAGLDLALRREVSPTLDAGVARVQVQVRLSRPSAEAGAPLADLTGFARSAGGGQ